MRGLPAVAVAVAMLVAGCSEGTVATSSSSDSADASIGASTSATSPPRTDDATAADASLGPPESPSLTPESSESAAATALGPLATPVDGPLVDVIGLVEASLLNDARASLPTAEPGLAAEGFRRREGRAGGLGSLGVLLTGTGDIAATASGPGSVSSTSTQSVSGASGSGTLTGSFEVGTDGAGRVSAEMSFEIDATNDAGGTGSLKVRGKVSGPVCPDASGLLEFDFEGEVSGAVNGVQVRHTFSGTATMQFDDNGEVAQFDVQLNVQANRTDASGRSSFVDFTTSLGFTGSFGSNPTATEKSIVTNRKSSTWDASNPDDQQMGFDGRDVALSFVNGVVVSRRAKVQENGCVIVEAVAQSTVEAAETVPVDVRTRHVIEGTALDKKVEATLSGEGSIDPNSLPSTPDKITYTAGDEPGDSGTLTLVSRSRRGIGTTTITISVASSYRVDQPVGMLGINGPVCALDEPFTLSVTGDLPGSLTFTPNDGTSGSFSGSGTAGPGTIEWTGTYTISGADGEATTLTIIEGTTTLQPGALAATGFWGDTMLTLIPDASTC